LGRAFRHFPGANAARLASGGHFMKFWAARMAFVFLS